MTKNLVDLNALEAVEHFQAAGLNGEAEEIISANENADLASIRWPWNRPPKLWEYSYAYGFIPKSNGATAITLQNMSSIQPDLSLKNAKITVSLDKLRIFDFPGKGVHNILFKFSANNFIGDNEESLSFNQTFSVLEGQIAPIAGYPVFIGLTVGQTVLEIQTQIVNASNDTDESILKIMDSDLFKKGLTLLGGINPVVPIVSQYATGITNMLLSRNQNVKINAPTMGLWFDNTAVHPKLAEGSYIAIQMPNPDTFEWDQYSYNLLTGALRKKDTPATDLPYNYFVFSISKMQ